MEQAAREQVQNWWNEAWGEGLWAAAWGKSLEGLTAEQAAWTPGDIPGERNSIWQIVLHMVFWRESWLRRVALATKGQKPTKEEIEAGNFPLIAEVSEAGWALARRRLEETQHRVAAVLADSAVDADIIAYLLPHDCYHFGQINYLRAMLGFKAIE